jgi:hypothetical protein
MGKNREEIDKYLKRWKTLQDRAIEKEDYAAAVAIEQLLRQAEGDKLYAEGCSLSSASLPAK